MKKFEASTWKEGVIDLASAEQMQELYETIESEENFILTWYEGDVKKSQLMIGNNFRSKIINGDLHLTAQESKKEE